MKSRLARRHLTETQRALVAARLATLKHGRPGKGEKETNWSLYDAAERLHVGTMTVKRARVILAHGTPELVAARLANLPAHRPKSKEKGANVPTFTVEVASKLLNVSPRNTKKGRVILTHGTPELVAAVDREAIRAPGFRSRGRGPGARSGVRRRCESSRIA